jgi:hypothetical protein
LVAAAWGSGSPEATFWQFLFLLFLFLRRIESLQSKMQPAPNGGASGSGAGAPPAPSSSAPVAPRVRPNVAPSKFGSLPMANPLAPKGPERLVSLRQGGPPTSSTSSSSGAAPRKFTPNVKMERKKPTYVALLTHLAHCCEIINNHHESLKKKWRSNIGMACLQGRSGGDSPHAPEHQNRDAGHAQAGPCVRAKSQHTTNGTPLLASPCSMCRL